MQGYLDKFKKALEILIDSNFKKKVFRSIEPGNYVLKLVKPDDFKEPDIRSLFGK